MIPRIPVPPPPRPPDTVEHAVGEIVVALQRLLALSRNPRRTETDEHLAVAAVNVATSHIIEAALGKSTALASSAAVTVIQSYREELDDLHRKVETIQTDMRPLQSLFAELVDSLTEHPGGPPREEAP